VVILAKTVKGYGLGKARARRRPRISRRSSMSTLLKAFRDRFHIPISDADIDPAVLPEATGQRGDALSCSERRKQLGGYLPAPQGAEPLVVPRSIRSRRCSKARRRAARLSTTMAFVRMLNGLLRDRHIGKRVVPIVPDEARTFGMEGMFRQIGIYSSVGQLYVRRRTPSS
jgi:pyruvate dehydrogenase E1 component